MNNSNTMSSYYDEIYHIKKEVTENKTRKISLLFRNFVLEATKILEEDLVFFRKYIKTFMVESEAIKFFTSRYFNFIFEEGIEINCDKMKINV